MNAGAMLKAKIPRSSSESPKCYDCTSLHDESWGNDCEGEGRRLQWLFLKLGQDDLFDDLFLVKA